MTLFGKNSDRPSDEEHEVVFVPGQRHAAGARVRCTYIEVPQVEETLSVVLSKPHWMWGCEMGANSNDVVGGNEAVWTRMASELDSQPRLLGMDILRLSLERGPTARDAARICAELTERHGQGGGCSEDDKSWTYENGYLFADSGEAFIVETCGVHGWAIERVPPGTYRNISNGVSIRADIFAIKDGLVEELDRRGWWKASVPFDWKAALGGAGQTAGALELCGRERAGHDFLASMAQDLKNGTLRTGDAQELASRMLQVLRDEDSGICFRDLHGFNSTGSQVSLLPVLSSSRPHAQHLFSCASDPLTASYKRFAFPLALAEAAQVQATDHGSLDLWRAWRKAALRRVPPTAAMQTQLVSWEVFALAALTVEDVSTGVKAVATSRQDFAEACRKELDLLIAETDGSSGA